MHKCTLALRNAYIRPNYKYAHIGPFTVVSDTLPRDTQGDKDELISNSPSSPPPLSCRRSPARLPPASDAAAAHYSAADGRRARRTAGTAGAHEQCQPPQTGNIWCVRIAARCCICFWFVPRLCILRSNLSVASLFLLLLLCGRGGGGADQVTQGSDCRFELDGAEYDLNALRLPTGCGV